MPQETPKKDFPVANTENARMETKPARSEFRAPAYKDVPIEKATDAPAPVSIPIGKKAAGKKKSSKQQHRRGQQTVEAFNQTWIIRPGKPPYPKGYELCRHSGGYQIALRVMKDGKRDSRPYRGYISKQTLEEMSYETVSTQIGIVHNIIRGYQVRAGEVT